MATMKRVNNKQTYHQCHFATYPKGDRTKPVCDYDPRKKKRIKASDCEFCQHFWRVAKRDETGKIIK